MVHAQKMAEEGEGGRRAGAVDDDAVEAADGGDGGRAARATWGGMGGKIVGAQSYLGDLVSSPTA